MSAMFDSYPAEQFPRDVRPLMATTTSSSARLELPDGAWDSHVHVVDEDRFPLHPTYPYRPRKADLDDLLNFESTLGISHVCLVAFSVYHTDNRSLIDALSRLKGRGRGVACIDHETVSDAELQELHDVGVRSVRVNLRTRGQRVAAGALQDSLLQVARRIARLKWSIQLYVALDQVALIAPVVPDLGTSVVIDHIGSPDGSIHIREQEGYTEFIDLLKRGLIYTKLSATYRFSQMPGLDEYIRLILRIAPDRVIWASDWPHSGGTEANPDGDRTKVQEYRKIDDKGWIRTCKAYCGNDPELIRKIWVDNPRRLWQYDEDD